MRILVTGAGGFVGREILRQHYVDECTIIGLDPKWDGATNSYCQKYFMDFPEAEFDVVYHCAAFVNGREGIDGSPAYMHTYNTYLDSAMFTWALKAKPGRIVYFSSSAAYPVEFQESYSGNASSRLKEQWVDLDAPEKPEASYGLSKLHGEQMARHVRAAGIPVTVLRPFSGYGAEQDQRYPFRAFLDRARAAENPFTVWGDGSQMRDWIHISDLVGAARAAVENGVDGPVNVCTGRGTTFRRMAQLFCGVAGLDVPIYYDLTKPAGVKYRVGDPTKMLEFYKPQYSIEDGIERAWKFGE